MSTNDVLSSSLQAHSVFLNAVFWRRRTRDVPDTIFNLILKCSVFPDFWKGAYICPVLKIEPKADAENNYRPICIACEGEAQYHHPSSACALKEVRLMQFILISARLLMRLFMVS